MANVVVKCMVAASAAVAAGVACAAPEVLQASRFGGSSLGEQVQFSADFLGVLDTGKMRVEAYAPGRVSSLRDEDGFYTQLNAYAPLATVSYENDPPMWANESPTGVTSTGGFTVVAPVVKSVSSGGSLTVTDLSVDLATKTVHATLIGGNGVGTLSNFALWNFSSATVTGPMAGMAWGACTATPPYFDCLATPYYQLSNTALTGLTITQDGLAKFAKSLGLLSLGKAAINGVTDYGRIEIGVLPEPSTYTLMGVGLLGIGLLAARRGRA